MTKKKVKLSIVIPVHNRHELFYKSLKSVLNQKTRFSKEIIIVDDTSIPTIKSYLDKKLKNKANNIKIYRNKKNSGPAVSRNVGFSKSSGEFILFLDSDDFLKIDFIQRMISGIEKSNSGAILCKLHPNFIDIKNPITIMKYYVLHLVREICFTMTYLFNKKYLPESFFYMTRLSGMVFKRSVVNKKTFSKKYKSAEDWKFLLELYKDRSFNVSIILDRLVTYTHHSNTETLGRTGYFKYYRDLIDEVPKSKRNSFGMKLFKMYSKYEKK